MINGKYISAKIRKEIIKGVTLKQNSCGAKIPHYSALGSSKQSIGSFTAQVELEHKVSKCNKKAKASATKFIEYSHAQRRIRTCECGFKLLPMKELKQINKIWKKW